MSEVQIDRRGPQRTLLDDGNILLFESFLFVKYSLHIEMQASELPNFAKRAVTSPTSWHGIEYSRHLAKFPHVPFQ